MELKSKIKEITPRMDRPRFEDGRSRQRCFERVPKKVALEAVITKNALKRCVMRRNIRFYGIGMLSTEIEEFSKGLCLMDQSAGIEKSENILRLYVTSNRSHLNGMTTSGLVNNISQV